MSAFNLSKTEFIAYLECPLQFYIIRSLNQGIPYGSRGDRDYSEFSDDAKDGMFWHWWFEGFHDKYYEDISNGQPAPAGETQKNTKIMKLFYEKERERFTKQPDFWFPKTTEQYLESENLRGEVDRIDQLNEQGDCLLIEYKKKKNQFDEQELLFYACLINQVDGIISEEESPIQITEVEVYYYLTGETMRRKLMEDEVASFKNYLQSIKEEIFMPNWVRKEECDMRDTNCKFKRICKNIPETLLLSNESQKIVE